MNNTEKEIIENAKKWLSETFDTETRTEVQRMLNEDPTNLKESFYRNLEFGTGGMRGIMGIGTNRINKYTLGKNTQGLSNYLKSKYPNQEITVVIDFDCRHNSNTLAKLVADVFTANGIKVFLFSDMRPTPELSFAVRYLRCKAGVVLTASHNPPEYNGYKVYLEDGGQLVTPNDAAVIEEIENIDYSEINFDSKAELLQMIDTVVDDAFVDSTIENTGFNTDQKDKDKLNIVYTPLHGTSIKIIPKVLEKVGYKNLFIVESQAEPNGDFPTVKSPNPEEPEAFKLALKLAAEKDADLIFGTDPDSDRIGIAVKDDKGEYILLNGNQTNVIMTAFLLEQQKHKSGFKGNEFIGSTIVSTPMMLDIAENYGVECKVGLTGFKWIAKMIKDNPEQKYLCGGEESFGFMVGDKVRDKDAVSCSLLICEIATLAKKAGSSIYGELINLYLDYSYYQEHLISIVKKGIEGAIEIEKMMEDLRNAPKAEIAGARVVCIEDYLSSTARNLITGETEKIDIPKSNVLIYYLEDGTKICARPSGTEPKIKFYFSLNKFVEDKSKLAETKQILKDKINDIIKDMNLN